MGRPRPPAAHHSDRPGVKDFRKTNSRGQPHGCWRGRFIIFSSRLLAALEVLPEALLALSLAFSVPPLAASAACCAATTSGGTFRSSTVLPSGIIGNGECEPDAVVG